MAQDLELLLIRQWLGLEADCQHDSDLSLLVLLVGSEGVLCQLDLKVIELPEHLASAHGFLVRAPGAALLELDSDFQAGLSQVQNLLQRVLQPAGSETHPCAVAWSLRALHKQDGSRNNVTPYLLQLDGPSLTAACAVGCLYQLRDHLAEPWKTSWHQVLRELKIKRFCATAAFLGHKQAATHLPDGVLNDPLQWALVPVGGVNLKFDALGRYLPNWGSGGDDAPSGLPIQQAFVAQHQDVSGNLVKAIGCATLADLILAAHQASEPLRLPPAFEALEAALVEADDLQSVSQHLLDAVHREPVPRWLAAHTQPSQVEAEKVLRVWWLKRLAHWASGRYQAFGPLRGGQTDEPVALIEHFHPIDIDPEPIQVVEVGTGSAIDDRCREPQRVNSLPELFAQCPDARAFRLHAAPAGGKTTLLAHHELHTALLAIGRFHRSGQWGELALWLPMRDYPANRASDPMAAEEALWARVQVQYPDLAKVLLAWRDDAVKLPGLHLRWLCDAVNEMPAEGEDQRQQAQGHLLRGLTEQGLTNAWLAPVFTVRTHSQNQALASARGCILLAWDAPSRLRYMEKRLGCNSPVFHTLKAAIEADPRDDRNKFFATPGHLAAQCTLMQAGIVIEPAQNRAQLFCTLLWLRLAQEQQRGQLPSTLLSDDERRKIGSLHQALAKPGGWRWPRRMGPLMQALSAMAVYQQHLDPASRTRQRQATEGERVWSMSAPRDWLCKPPQAAATNLTNAVDEDALVRATQHLNLLHFDDAAESLTWTHQLWLELFAALGLNPWDEAYAWIDAPVSVLPDVEALLEASRANGIRKCFSIPPVAEEETLGYLIQLHGDVVSVVQRVLGAGNAPLAARLVLDNWYCFGEPQYPQEDPQGPWRPERKDAETGGTHPVLNALRRALHERMYSPAVHIAQRIEAGELLGQLGGSPLFRICGQALVLKDEHWAQIGEPGQTIDFEMGDLLGDSDECTDEGKLYKVKGLPSFRMAGFLVTLAQFHCFAQSKSYGDAVWWPGEAGRWWAQADKTARLPSSHGGYQAKTGLAPVCCNFWQAQAYGLWESTQRRQVDEGRSGITVSLPSEAQWEGAARWSAYQKDRSIQHGADRWRFAHTPGRPENRYRKDVFTDVRPWDFNHWRLNSGVSPVGVFVESAAPLGLTALHDLAGNVWEWTTSAFQPRLAVQSLQVASGTESRTLRGGSCDFAETECRVGSRVRSVPGGFSGNDGLRLVVAVGW